MVSSKKIPFTIYLIYLIDKNFYYHGVEWVESHLFVVYLLATLSTYFHVIHRLGRFGCLSWLKYSYLYVI